MTRIRCAVVGATGIAGQQFLAALADHPYLSLTTLAASERSAGKKYIDALRSDSGQIRWYLPELVDPRFANMELTAARDLPMTELDLVFSAVESDAARELEQHYAKELPVISTASAFRYERDVPIIIPAVNHDHAKLVECQRRRNRDWKGFIIPIPNCTTTGLVIALAPLHRAFGVERVLMTSMQAVSGAGRSPGVAALDIIDNVVPYIPKEEEKVVRETRKLLGVLGQDEIHDAPIAVSANCTRVPVQDGHFETVNVALQRPASLEAIKGVMNAFGTDISAATHPSAPRRWITVCDDPYRPQPRIDREQDHGMTTTVGRLRQDDILGANGIRFMLVSHNTKMGAARGAVLLAEDLHHRGLL